MSVKTKKESKRIVFGVFDWGLGHATRSKPLVEKLLQKGCSVDFITTGRALVVLKEHFGDRCGYFDVPSIVSPYTKSKHFAISFVRNGPRMLKSLKDARKQSKRIIEDGGYDLVISDCRYDVFGERKNSFLINHQLRFAAPAGAELFMEGWLAHRMKKYHRIIVPDYPHKENLSGKLSHKMNFLKKKRIEYIGQLSHLGKKKCKKDIDYFIVLTGPEPQRSMLEELVFKQARDLDGKVVIAGGNPDPQKLQNIPKNIEYHPYLGSEEMESHLNRSEFFISRSGYTSMMELVEFGISKALLIPTPGQTEQEYLADFYEKRGYFHHVHQDKLNLKKDVRNCKRFTGFKPDWNADTSAEHFLRILEI